jgi:hypothetical protein
VSKRKVTGAATKAAKNGAAIPKRDKSHKARDDARQRQAQANRREKVAELYHAGLLQDEIADKLHVAQSTVSQDLAFLRHKWTEQATSIIGNWIAQELAYVTARRAELLAHWREARDPRDQATLVRWTQRIADLLGLDAPSKVDDWTEKDWREFALANGLNEADVIAEAEEIIHSAAGSTPLHPPGDCSEAPEEPEPDQGGEPGSA